MGQSISNVTNAEISESAQTQLQKRFIVTPHPVYVTNPEFKLLHERMTGKKYVLRVLSVSDDYQRGRMEECIFRKISNRNGYLPKLEHYIFEDCKGYCGTMTKCYLFFELGDSTTFREQILKQTTQRAPFTQEELMKGLQNLILGLLWLRYFKEPHENVNTYNIFYTAGSMVLGDPLMCPPSIQNPQRYLSPEKQAKIDGTSQSYDPYVSDVFGVAMCMLQAVRLGKLQKVYKRNGKLNMQVLIEEVGKCQYDKLREVLQRLLVNGNNSQHREHFMQGFTKPFHDRLLLSHAISDKTVKIHSGGIRRLYGKTSQSDNGFITANDVNRLKFQQDGKPRDIAADSNIVGDTSPINNNQNRTHQQQTDSKFKLVPITTIGNTNTTHPTYFNGTPLIDSNAIISLFSNGHPQGYPHANTPPYQHYQNGTGLSHPKTNGIGASNEFVNRSISQYSNGNLIRFESQNKPAYSGVSFNIPGNTLSTVPSLAGIIPTANTRSSSVNKPAHSVSITLPSFNGGAPLLNDLPKPANRAAPLAYGNIPAVKGPATSFNGFSYPQNTGAILRGDDSSLNRAVSPLKGGFFKGINQKSSKALETVQNSADNPVVKNEFKRLLSAQKFIPIFQSTDTPIQNLQVNTVSSSKNDPLPLSHLKDHSKQEYSKRLFQQPYSSPSESNYFKIDSYKNISSGSINNFGDVFNSERKIYKEPKLTSDSLSSKDLSFPHNKISPIKKYSENHIFQKYLHIYEIKKKHQQELANLQKEIKQEKQIREEKQAKAILQSQEQPKINGNREDNKATPTPSNKAQNQSQPPPSSGNSQFSKIIDQNFFNLEQGVSDAIQNSIKSLQTKKVTDFTNNQAHRQLQAYARNPPIPNQGPQRDLTKLECLPMMKSEIISVQNNQNSEQNSHVNSNDISSGQNQSYRLYSIQIPSLDNQTENRVKSSLSQEQSESIIKKNDSKPYEQPPKTPLRQYNPNLQIQQNRTIPQQDPAQQQSIDDQHAPHQPAGEYKELQYENGGRYCGFVINNQRNGEGTFYYKDGGYYEGQWKNNAMNGYGKLYYDDGRLAYQGQWYHDQFHGRGKVYNDSALQLLTAFKYKTFQDLECYWMMYDGDLSHDLKEGYGKLVLSNNQYYTGKFKNDRPDGQGYFYGKEKTVHGFWSNGNLLKQI